jgi:peptidyl-prolyl cis-trans isomerase D
MLGGFRNRRAGVFIYALLALLFVGLAGFGIGAGRGISSQAVAKVGGRQIEANDYVRAMQQELRALTQQLGRDLPMTEARQYGVDRMVLAQLLNDAALDGEAARIGVATSDDEVRRQVMATKAFQGPDGKLDRATYTDAVGRIGLTPGE